LKSYLSSHAKNKTMIRTKSAEYMVKDNSNTRYIKLKLISMCSDNGKNLHVSKISKKYDEDTISTVQSLSKGDYVRVELEKEENAWIIYKIEEVY